MTLCKWIKIYIFLKIKILNHKKISLKNRINKNNLQKRKKKFNIK